MPTFSSNKGYALPTIGGDTNVWGSELNGNFSILDANLGGKTAPIDVTLAASITLTASQAQQLVIFLTGTIVVDTTVNFPAVGGFWIVQTTYTAGAVNLFAACTGGGSSAILNVAGSYLIYSDGTNMFVASFHA